MRHPCLGAILLSMVLFRPSLAAAQAPDAGPDLAANAALKYWQAFALLPALNKDQEKLLEEWNKMPLDPAAKELIGRYRMSRVYLHRGAQLPRCNWSEDYEDGIRMLLPHLQKTMTLVRLAALNARHEFAEGDWKAGSEDVVDLLKLARHLELDRLMIPNLVGPRIEAIAIEAAAPYLPELKRALPEVASDVLDAPSTGATLAEMVLMEKQIGPIWLIEELKAAERRKEGSWQGVWNEIFDTPNEGGTNPERHVGRSVTTFDQAIKGLEAILPWYDQLARLAALPREEFDAQYPEFVKKAKAASEVGGLLLPAVDKMVEVQRRNQAQRALFKAAIAVVQSGPEKLKDIKDPFGNGPFEYRVLDGGFELKSKLILRGHPVTLVAGQGKKS